MPEKGHPRNESTCPHRTPHATLVVERWKQPKVHHLTMDKHMWCIQMMKYSLAIKRNEAITCSDTEGPRKHDSERTKPDTHANTRAVHRIGFRLQKRSRTRPQGGRRVCLVSRAHHVAPLSCCAVGLVLFARPDLNSYSVRPSYVIFTICFVLFFCVNVSNLPSPRLILGIHTTVNIGESLPH